MNQYEHYFNDQKYLPKNIIFIYPEFKWTKARIINRWNSEKIKWSEGNFQYLKKLRKNYKKYFRSLERKKDINILFLKKTDPLERSIVILNYIKRM